MGKILQDLETAFRQVTIENYKWTALNSKGGDYQQEAENNFSSEIIGNFRNLMRHPENSEFYKGLSSHFDVTKNRFRDIRPDIVLHESPHTQTRQEFFVEVKTSDVSLIDDLKKLELAISNKLNFKYGVLIVVNKPLEKTVRQINEYISEKENIDLKKLVLFHGAIHQDKKNIDYVFTNFEDLCN